MPIVRQTPKLTSFILIGGTNDAPGIRLVPDGSGGWKIEKVPGWNPEEMVELGAAIKLAAGGARLKHEKISGAIVSNAAELATEQLARAGLAAGEGATVVVVVG